VGLPLTRAGSRIPGTEVDEVVAGPAVVVSGALANKPKNGGEAWVRMSWIRGLQRLGCEVTFVEEIAERACVDDVGRPENFKRSLNRRWFGSVVGSFGLDKSSSLLCGRRATIGLERSVVEDRLAQCDLLVNISGNLVDEKLRARARRTAYVDLDPGFTQFWLGCPERNFELQDHDCYFTVGANIGTPECSIPTGGISWIPMWPPVVLEDWFVANTERRPKPRFTTVGSWRGPFGPVERDGERLGLKVHEFRKFIGVPEAVGDAQFEIALSIDPIETADLELLAAHRWNLVDPVESAGTPDYFARYVAASDAEFSVAQEMYVATRSGWFSDRTTRYLASGRPVLVQDTGFAERLPTGRGLLAFSDVGSAVAGARSILDDYPEHARAARMIAEEHFDSDRVLGAFLARCLP